MSKEVKDSQEQEELHCEENVCEDQSVEQDKEEKEIDPIVELSLKMAEINDKYLRLSAEFDNYRKRTLKEKMELTKSAGEQILVNILPVMDNFERALQSIGTTEDVVALKEGVDLIYLNFKEFLLLNGVKEVECVDSEFDPEIQEAITKIPAPTEELKGKVVDCIQKGYILHDKLIRFPKVIVGE